MSDTVELHMCITWQVILLDRL